MVFAFETGASPEATRGGATAVHRPDGLVVSISVAPAGRGPDGAAASSTVVPGSSSSPHPGLSAGAPLVPFLRPQRALGTGYAMHDNRSPFFDPLTLTLPEGEGTLRS